MRKTITLHDHGSAAGKSVALLPAPVAAPVPPPRDAEVPNAEVRGRVTPQTLGLIAVVGSLAAVIVTAFGVTGVLMLIGLCVALRLMWTDRAGR